MHETSPAAAALCPLCGQPNACAEAAQSCSGLAQAPCWCNDVKFSAELIARVPDAARGRMCICRACASPTSAA